MIGPTLDQVIEQWKIYVGEASGDVTSAEGFLKANWRTITGMLITTVRVHEPERY